MEIEILDVGDKVKHSKFGVGTVMQRFGENENQKVLVKFGAEYGEKKLVTKIANMKRISERPTLQAAPAAPGTFPGAAAAAGPGIASPATGGKSERINLEALEAEAEDLEVEDDEELEDGEDLDEGDTFDEEAETEEEEEE